MMPIFCSWITRPENVLQFPVELSVEEVTLWEKAPWDFQNCKVLGSWTFPSSLFSSARLGTVALPLQPRHPPLDQDCFAEASQELIYVLTKATTCKEAVCLSSFSVGWRFLLHRCCSRRHCVIQLQESQRAGKAKICLGQLNVVLCGHGDESLSFDDFESCW